MTSSENEISRITHVQHDSCPPIPQISSETGSSSQESQRTNRGSRLVDPTPLYLAQSNRHHGSSQSSVLGISEEQLPRVGSSLQPTVQDQHLSSSPDFDLPSEAEQWQRRLQKVTRTLGEQVPPELVYRSGPKPITISALPEQPLLGQTDTLTRRERRENNKSVRLARSSCSSLTLVPFPNLSSVAAALLPARHGQGESYDHARLDGTVTSIPNSSCNGGLEEGLDTGDSAHPHLEQMSSSPVVPAKDATLPRRRAFRLIPKNKSRPATAAGALESHSSQCQVLDTKKAARLPRRASLHAITTVPPTSPADDRRNDRRGDMGPASEIYVDSHLPRPEFVLLSPVEFSKPTLPLTVEDQDCEDGFSSGSQISSLRHKYHYKSYAESMSGRRRLGSSSSYSSNPDVLSLYSRSNTPFVDSAAPLEPEISAHRDSVEKDPRDAVVRKERRQGWSGEWNRGDMQVVIKKLRSLK
jgi:hypothetical protein